MASRGKALPEKAKRLLRPAHHQDVAMLSLFQRKRVPLATAAAPPPVEPAKGLTPPQSATSLLAEPRRLPVGSAIFCRAVFDNSEANLANPDPTASVRWGEQSWEEMMLGFFDVMLPRSEERKAATKPVTTGLDVVGLFDTADTDENGGLAESEATGHDLLRLHFTKIDQNSDSLLQLGEILGALRLMAGRR